MLFDSVSSSTSYVRCIGITSASHHPPSIISPAKLTASLPSFPSRTEALTAYNKQRLAYVLRSLHQQQDAEDAGQPAGTGAGDQAGQRQEIDAYLEEALHDPRVDAAAKREILSKWTHVMVVFCSQNEHLPHVRNVCLLPVFHSGHTQSLPDHYIALILCVAFVFSFPLE
jgi:hypothetical protein